MLRRILHLFINRVFNRRAPSASQRREQIARKGPAPGAKREKIFNVGLDFGTSSSKVVIRDLETSKSTVFMGNEPSEGMPLFAIPSTIAVRGGECFFGTKAEQLQGARVFRSFKICMACQMNLVACRKCDANGELTSPQGFFRLDDSDDQGKIVLSAEFLGVVYVGYVIGLVDRWLARHFVGCEISVTYNVSVPLDQIDVSVAERRYNYLFFLAANLSGRVFQGVPLSKLRLYWNELTQAEPVLPDESHRSVFVQPETVAAVMPYARSRTANPGLYAIVDVGAGTTDISFFRLGPKMPRDLSFYYAKTGAVGGDDLDKDIASWLNHNVLGDTLTGGRLADLKHSIRNSKQSILEGIPTTLRGADWEVTVPSPDIGDISSGSLRRMRDTLESAWIGAFLKEKGVSRWATYNIVFLGGGSRAKVVRDNLTSPPRDFIQQVHPVDIRPTIDLLVDNKNLKMDVEQNIDFICVAYGLSFPPPDFRKVRFPNVVHPMLLPEAPSPLPDREDLYPK